MSFLRSLIILLLLFCVVGVVPAVAASPGWDVSGASFDVEFTCIVGEDPPYGGTLDIDLMNPFNGNFVGTINDGTYTFPVTGNVSGSSITFDINFDVWEFTTKAFGTIAKDGSISGHAHIEDGNQYTFTSTSGGAVSLKADKDRRGGFFSWGGAFFSKQASFLSRGRGLFGKNGLLFGKHDKGGKGGKNERNNKNDKDDKNDKRR